jgi:hypothetical protein
LPRYRRRDAAAEPAFLRRRRQVVLFCPFSDPLLKTKLPAQGWFL